MTVGVHIAQGGRRARGMKGNAREKQYLLNAQVLEDRLLVSKHCSVHAYVGLLLIYQFELWIQCRSSAAVTVQGRDFRAEPSGMIQASIGKF